MLNRRAHGHGTGHPMYKYTKNRVEKPAQRELSPWNPYIPAAAQHHAKHRDQHPANYELLKHPPASKGREAQCQHQNCKLQHSGLFHELHPCMPFLQLLTVIHSLGQGKKKQLQNQTEITRGVTALTSNTTPSIACGAPDARLPARQEGFSTALQGALAIGKDSVTQQGGC